MKISPQEARRLQDLLRHQDFEVRRQGMDIIENIVFHESQLYDIIGGRVSTLQALSKRIETYPDHNRAPTRLPRVHYFRKH